MSKLLGVVLTAALLAGCVTEEKYGAFEPKGELGAPKATAFADYGPAMASHKGYEMAYEWQCKDPKAVEAATKREVLAGFVASDAASDALLAKIGTAYDGDPIALTQIAAVTQLVMCPKCPKAPKNRAKWTAALLAAAKDAPDTYRQMFFLDQLRWCGHADEADAVRAIGKASKDKAVKDFAEQVAQELAK